MPRKLKIEHGKRYSLSARTTFALNQALKAAAEANGRSVSQEIEFRLEASFAEDRMRSIAREEVARCWEMTSLAVAEEERAALQHDVATVEQVVNGRH